MSNFTCSFCGFPDLDQPPFDETGAPSFEICPCCGGEFGYNDASQEAEKEYRRKWIQNGAQWFDSSLKPTDWKLRNQLLNIGINLDAFFN
jgi:hypothetical protein